MNEITSYIEQLLYTHDCVIVPNFGGFIVHYMPATIHFIENKIYPPKKRVSFNQKLIDNDGVLVNFIAQAQGISYKAAQEKATLFAKQLVDELVQKSVLHLPNIGRLYFNQEAKLEFTPEATNFMREMYGLPTLVCKPILRSKDHLIETLGNQASNNHALAVPRKSTALIRFSQPQVAAISGVTFLMLSLPLLWYIFQDPNSHKNSENAVQGASTLPYISNSYTKNTNTTATDTIALAKVSTPATTTEDPPVEDPLIVKHDKNSKTYIIVIGAFSDAKNAKRMLRKLERDGYFPDLEKTGSLQRIGIQITCLPNEISKHLADIRQKFNKKAWVIEE